jgi:hypothetical protein
MPRKLKVFRTPIGFHDAYVAAPTKKAAMEAWGTDRNLFARGDAEEVTEAALTAEPLASPGKVIKRLRGTAAEQIAALGKDEPRKAVPRGGGAEQKTAGGRPSPRRPARPAAKPKPRPSRGELDEAEGELSSAEARHAAELKEIARKEAELARERKALQRAQAEEISRLERRRDKARAAYDASMAKWRG